MFPKKKKEAMVKNSENLNTPISLFNKVPSSMVEGPKQFNDDHVDIITVEPEVLDQWDEQEKERDDCIIKEIEKEWDVVDSKPAETFSAKGHKEKARKRTLQKYISLKCGSDGRKLLDRIIEQAFYTWDSTVDVKPKYSDETVRFSQKLLFEWGYSKPAQKEEKTIEVTVEHRMDEALRLIHENRKKVKQLN
jgi:hypothetical protein